MTGHRIASPDVALEAALARALQSNEKCVLIVDLQGGLIAVNPAACQLLDRTETQLRAARWWVELDARTEEGVALVGHTSFGRRAIASGDPLRDQTIDIARPDGSRMWLSVDYEPLRNEAGAVGGLALSMRDITHRPSQAPARMS